MIKIHTTKDNTFRIAILVSILLLLTHIVLFFFCWYYQINLMITFNMISICVYLIGVLLILYFKYLVFLNVAFIEIWLHTIFISISLGWNYGFQMYCIAIIPVIFFTDYIAKHEGKKNNSELMNFFTICVYFFSYYMTRHHAPLYVIPDVKIVNTIYITNNFITAGALCIFVGLFTKIIIRSEAILQDKAQRDELTRLFNRHYMRDQLEDIYADHKKTGTEYWTAIIDIDSFKSINDTYGHNCGDYVLKKLSFIISTPKNMEFTVSRWGGEEFLLCGKTPASINDVYILLDQIRKDVESAEFNYNRKVFHVTVTVGIAKLESYMTVDSWVRLADDRLYKGKENGKNRVVI